MGDNETGDETALDRLLPLLYEELRRLAAQQLSHEKPGQSLNATAQSMPRPPNSSNSGTLAVAP